jgi:hypothetical protein
MDNICTGLAVVKSWIDMYSPWMDSKYGDPYGQKIAPIADLIINVAWQVPTVGILVHQLKEHAKWNAADINAIVGCAAGTAFDASGWLSPVLAYNYYFTPPSESRTGMLNGTLFFICGFNALWGIGGLLTTFDTLPVPS